VSSDTFAARKPQELHLHYFDTSLLPYLPTERVFPRLVARWPAPREPPPFPIGRDQYDLTIVRHANARRPVTLPLRYVMGGKPRYKYILATGFDLELLVFLYRSWRFSRHLLTLSGKG
jgi:hypothetical protein